MEVINIFLESDTGRVKLAIDSCEKDKNFIPMWKAVDIFIKKLRKYIDVEKSSFYLVIKNKDIFYFKYNKGSVTQLENEFFTFNENRIFVNSYNEIIGIEFIITDTMPISIYPLNNILILASSNNKQFYD
ncbi:41L protein [Yaba-like disease virus]|uniref:41L protein n=1 Tax=Yaba-like disease virus TaxID=132475 RepID=Q9DHS1_YLDV|nr:41L protein [Yaba-like disease virus]CAC21279.1 41L protein [Yaba-like disease virus]